MSTPAEVYAQTMQQWQIDQPTTPEFRILGEWKAEVTEHGTLQIASPWLDGDTPGPIVNVPADTALSLGKWLCAMFGEANP